MQRGQETEEMDGDDSGEESPSECQVCGEEVGAEDIHDPPIKAAKSPSTPSSEEVLRHCTTHMPHRSWCPI